jgi:hypothetical protein
VCETDTVNPLTRVRNAPTKLVLPAPEGADTTNNVPFIMQKPA